MSDLMDLTWNNPMRKSLWSIEGVPIKMTWMISMRMSLSKWSDLIELKWIERFEVIWVNWRKWARTTLWESPYGQKKVSLWEWLDVSENESPYQNDQNRWDLNELKWIEVNRGEMSDLMEMTWNNPMEKSLWSVEGVPIKVTGMNPMRKSLSKWMESMRNEWNEVNRGE